MKGGWGQFPVFQMAVSDIEIRNGWAIVYISAIGNEHSVFLMADENGQKKAAWVDKGICIGCCLCASLAPGVYRMRDDGKSEVFSPEGATEPEVQATIDSCPVTAISWQDRKKVDDDISQQKAEGR